MTRGKNEKRKASGKANHRGRRGCQAVHNGMKTIKIYRSFSEQETDEIQHWYGLSGEQKLNVLESIRANYWAMNRATPKRLQRLYKIIKRTPG